MLNARDYVGGRFIKADDVRDGPRREIIRNVTPGKYEKLNVQFVSGDHLSLNATNTRVLMRAYGEDAEAWVRRGLARYEKYGGGLWLVLEKESRQPVGQVGLIHQLIEGIDETEVGYLLHRPY